MIGPSMINTRPDNTSILHFCKTIFQDYPISTYRYKKISITEISSSTFSKK